MDNRYLVGAVCLKKISLILLEEMPRIARESGVHDTRPTERMLREVVAAAEGLGGVEDDATKWKMLELGAPALRIVSPVNAGSLRANLQLMDEMFGVDD